MDSLQRNRITRRRFLLTHCLIAGCTALGCMRLTPSWAAEIPAEPPIPEIDRVLLGLDPDAEAKLPPLGMRIGQSVTCDGVTVTLDAAAGDGARLICAFTVERSDGQPLVDDSDGPVYLLTSSNMAWNNDGMWIENESMGERCYDIDLTGTSSQIVTSASFDSPYDHGAPARYTITEIMTSQGETIASGAWEFEFSMPMCALALRLPGGNTIAFDDAELTTSEIVLSPLGVTAYFDMPFVPGNGRDKAAQALIAHIEKLVQLPVIITLKDGSEVKCGPGGGMANSSSGSMAQRRASVTELIDVAQITQLTIGDAVIDMPWPALWESPEVDQILLGLAPDADEKLSLLGERIDQSVTSDGVTITLDAVAGDGVTLIALFTVGRDDGEPFDCDVVDGRTGAIHVYSGMHVSYMDRVPQPTSLGGTVITYDCDPDDSKLQMMVYMRPQTPYEDGENVSIELRDLTGSKAGPDLLVAPDRVVLATGPWAFEFVAPVAQGTVKLPVDMPINVGGTECIASRIILSPLGVTVAFPTPGFSWEVVDGVFDITLDDVAGLPIAAIMSDGSKIVIGGFRGGASRNEDEGVVERSAYAANLIDVSRVTQVVIGDTAIDVP